MKDGKYKVGDKVWVVMSPPWGIWVEQVTLEEGVDIWAGSHHYVWAGSGLYLDEREIHRTEEGAKREAIQMALEGG